MIHIRLDGNTTDTYGNVVFIPTGGAVVEGGAVGSINPTVLKSPSNYANFYCKNAIMNPKGNDFTIECRFYFGEYDHSSSWNPPLFAIADDNSWGASSVLTIYDSGWYEGHFYFEDPNNANNSAEFTFYVETPSLTVGWHTFKLIKEGRNIDAYMDDVIISTYASPAKYYGIFTGPIWEETKRISQLPDGVELYYDKLADPTFFLLGGYFSSGLEDALGFTYGQIDYFDLQINSQVNAVNKKTYAFIL